MVPPLMSFHEGPHQKLLFQGKKLFFQNSTSKMANCITVGIVNFLILYLVNS